MPQAAEAIIEAHSLRDGFAVKVAVQTAWDEATQVAQRLPIVSQMGHVILYARVLALVTCPDPSYLKMSVGAASIGWRKMHWMSLLSGCWRKQYLQAGPATDRYRE